MDIESEVYRLWKDGRQPKTAAASIKKSTWQDVSPEWVRMQFAKFSQGRA